MALQHSSNALTASMKLSSNSGCSTKISTNAVMFVPQLPARRDGDVGADVARPLELPIRSFTEGP